MTHLQTQLLCFWKLVLNVCVCVGGGRKQYIPLKGVMRQMCVWAVVTYSSLFL